MTVIEIEGAAGAAAALGRRRAEQVWVRRLGWFAAVCVAAASLFGVLGLVDIVHGVTAWPAALPIREPGEASGWFNVSVHPLAGRRGYSFWRLQDITARHEMEEVIRDEQNKLVDFLDNAPIGFYSVDGSGRFLFINETLAQWLGGAPDEIIHSGARLQDFLAAEAPPGVPAHAPFDPAAGGGSPGAQLVLKGRHGPNV